MISIEAMKFLPYGVFILVKYFAIQILIFLS